ncbi:MAG: hypothetical protein HDR72_00710 [Ruminococcaceae bacterium]|nr:hypothetical protein [Oscillospiraceae bacterium]
MKRFFSILIIVMFVFSLSACNMSEKENKSNTESSSFSSTSADGGLSDDDDITARVLAEYPNAEITKVVEKEDGSVSITYRVDGRAEVMTLYADGSIGISGLDLFEENFPAYEEVQAEYPDKTVLVWVFDETLYEHHAPFHTKKVNEYLDEQGCDFAVCFKPLSYEYEYIDDMHPSLKPDPMLTEVKKILDNGGRIDIISPHNYDEYVFDGLYEQLDEYLETDIGRELYSALPEKLWDSLRINGGIYGLSGTVSNLSPDRGYYVNAELAEKYGYDVTKPILEQLDILKAVKENEKKTDVFAAYADIDNIVTFVNVKMLSSAVYWNSETHSAELSLDNPQYIEWLRLYDTLNKEGLMKKLNMNNSDSFFIWSKTAFGGGIGYEDMKTVELDYFGNTVTAVPVFTPHSTVRSAVWATGICSKSEHKDEAFELLTKVFTDPVPNNLLVYGVEGENYILKNGIVRELENTNTDAFNMNPHNTDRFANEMICHRSEDNLFTPEQYADIFEKAEVFGDIDFVLDPTSIISELNAEYIAADKLKLPKEYESLDDILAEYREGLYAAGVQKIIDECNRQYEVYKNEKN